jgi:hypothetical protein
VTVVCEEEGTVFADPRSLIPLSGLTAETVMCPGCNATMVADFEPADSSQIQAAGLKPGEYV